MEVILNVLNTVNKYQFDWSLSGIVFESFRFPCPSTVPPYSQWKRQPAPSALFVPFRCCILHVNVPRRWFMDVTWNHSRVIQSPASEWEGSYELYPSNVHSVFSIGVNDTMNSLACRPRNWTRTANIHANRLLCWWEFLLEMEEREGTGINPFETKSVLSMFRINPIRMFICFFSGGWIETRFNYSH